MGGSLTVAFCCDAAAGVLAWLVHGVIYGSVFAGVTWLLIRVSGRRLTFAFQSLLWSVVLIKFFVPIGPLYSFSFSKPVDSVIGSNSQQDFAVEGGMVSLKGVLPANILLAGDCETHHELEQPGLHWSVLAGLGYLFAVGVLIFRRTACHVLFVMKCRALHHADESVHEIVANACFRLGVRRRPLVCISRTVPSAFVFGFLRPTLVLAHRQLLRREELETVILHEVAHLRRSDMIVRYLQWFAGSFFFFWPVVAWVNQRIDLAREHACDEWALRQGPLSAGAYARCLLNAMQPLQGVRRIYRSTGLTSNHKSMERRIDMILEYPDCSTRRTGWSLFGGLLLTLWIGFAFTGAVDAAPDAHALDSQRPATEEALKKRSTRLYGLVAAIDIADFNGDGLLTYTEKDAYLIGLAMQRPQAFMDEFPYADRNQSGQLDYLEIYGVIRGITLIAYADRRPNAMTDTKLIFLFYHMALDAQEWLLENVESKPKRAVLDNVWSVIQRVDGRRSNDHHRKLDHGGLPQPEKLCKEGLSRFKELEGNIETIRAKLAQETDPREATRLRVKLGKLKSLLDRLEGR